MIHSLYWTALSSAIVAVALQSTDPAPKTVAQSTVELLLLEKPVAGGLGFRFPASPNELFELSTCEAVLTGDRDLGVFVVAPTDKDWKREKGAWSYTWTLKNEVKLRFTATPASDVVKLEYTLENGGKEPLERLQIHPCLPTVGAPSFYPGSDDQALRGADARAARAKNKNWGELWDRLFVWRDGKTFSFASSALAKTEVHLAFNGIDATPTSWSWWKNAPESFGAPWIALRSKDNKRVLSMAFDRSNWISSNVGDARACIHVFPWFGTLAPGETKTVRGEICLLDGGLDEARARLEKDFPPPRGK